MPLTTSTFAQFQALLATQYSSQASLPANTNPGSTLGAIFNAAALMGLTLQNELVYIDNVARLATSTGADIDAFVLPFGIIRLAASASSGQCTLSTPSPVTAPLVIPVGGVVSTTTGIQFVIQADPTNATGFYSSASNGYVIPIGQSSANVLVTCSVSGTVGNVAAGTITQVYSGTNIPQISGIQTVTNAAAFANAVNVESDAALVTRFTYLMSTGLVGTNNALSAAIMGVQPGLTFSVGDGLSASGQSFAAYVSIYVNILGQSTAPPSSLITAVQSAVSAVKAAGAFATVYAPTIAAVTAAATIHVPINVNAATVLTNCVAAYQNYVNNIGLNPTGGQTEVDFFSVGAILRNVANVTKIDNLLLNSGTADVVANFGTQLVAGATTFTAASP